MMSLSSTTETLPLDRLTLLQSYMVAEIVVVEGRLNYLVFKEVCSLVAEGNCPYMYLAASLVHHAQFLNSPLFGAVLLR